jgi:hypothetical protein
MTGAGQILASPGRSAVSGSARDHRGRVKSKVDANQSGFALSLIVAIEQWICLLLGIACMVAGTLGMSMNPGQHSLPAQLAWTGLAYVPLLRRTAAACVGLGAVLVRMGWTGRSPHPARLPHANSQGGTR